MIEQIVAPATRPNMAEMASGDWWARSSLTPGAMGRVGDAMAPSTWRRRRRAASRNSYLMSLNLPTMGSGTHLPAAALMMPMMTKAENTQPDQAEENADEAETNRERADDK